MRILKTVIVVTNITIIVIHNDVTVGYLLRWFLVITFEYNILMFISLFTCFVSKEIYICIKKEAMEPKKYLRNFRPYT